MDNNCLQCSQQVRPRQEGLQCDECRRWCHRTCGTAITRAQYRTACRTGYIDWACQPCTTSGSKARRHSTSTLDQTNDDSDASDLGSFVEPAIHNASEMDDPSIPVETLPEMPGPITYRVVEGASSLGKDVLVDSLGYQYTMKVDKRRTAITWRCHHRSKNLTCRATAVQQDGIYIRGSQHHVCNAEPGRVNVLEVRKEIKARAKKRVFDSATEIVEEVLLEKIPPGQMALHPTLPKPVNIARQSNRKRRKTRPQVKFVMTTNQRTATNNVMCKTVT